jgi:sugar-specific transcriptional regulator TrmB
VLKILESFGLARPDAEVYVYLAKKGPKAGKEIANALKLSKTQLSPILERLQKRRFISTNAERPALFSALAFEQILDVMITFKDEEAQTLKETRKELLSCWRAITRNKKQANA